MIREAVIATGDPQGVGPFVSVRAARQAHARRRDAAFVLCGDAATLLRAGADPAWPAPPAGPVAAGIFVARTAAPGALDAPPPSAEGGGAALLALDAAFWRVARAPATRALVTAPVSKEAVRRVDPAFDGHTGWLARRLGALAPVMLFATPTFKVALATVHVPLARVPTIVTATRLRDVVQVVVAGLRERFGIASPRVHVLGLNPHAGEGGAIGTEERDELAPEIARLAASGTSIAGPFPADSYFRPGFERRADVVIAQYHDQGLLPVKCLAFGTAVNVTLGIPIVRTSVDHGTAFDRAWTDDVDAASMERAIDVALDLLPRAI